MTRGNGRPEEPVLIVGDPDRLTSMERGMVDEDRRAGFDVRLTRNSDDLDPLVRDH